MTNPKIRYTVYGIAFLAGLALHGLMTRLLFGSALPAVRTAMFPGITADSIQNAMLLYCLTGLAYTFGVIWLGQWLLTLAIEDLCQCERQR